MGLGPTTAVARRHDRFVGVGSLRDGALVPH
jgi:hypothetical protein